VGEHRANQLYSGMMRNDVENVANLLETYPELLSARVSNSEYGNISPFRMACCYGLKDIVDVFIAHGQNVSEPNNEPLWDAAERGHYTVVCKLLKAGANPSQPIVYDLPQYILGACCMNRHFRIAELLIRYGANVDVYALEGCSILSLAEEYDPEFAMFLKECGATEGGNLIRWLLDTSGCTVAEAENAVRQEFPEDTTWLPVIGGRVKYRGRDRGWQM
jgi:hypothetical protein